MLFSYVVETMIVVGNMIANDNYKKMKKMIDIGERGVGRLKKMKNINLKGKKNYVLTKTPLNTFIFFWC
jgi:hypothetical protein